MRVVALLREMVRLPKPYVGCLAASLGMLAMAGLAFRSPTGIPDLVDMPHGKVPEPQWWLSP